MATITTDSIRVARDMLFGTRPQPAHVPFRDRFGNPKEYTCVEIDGRWYATPQPYQSMLDGHEIDADTDVDFSLCRLDRGGNRMFGWAERPSDPKTWWDQ